MREDIAKSMPDMSKGGSPNFISQKNMETWASHNSPTYSRPQEASQPDVDYGFSENDYYVSPYDLSDEDLETLVQRLQNARNHYHDIGDDSFIYWQEKLEAAVQVAQQRGLAAGRKL